MQLASNVTDTALVLEGGGMRAAYTAGLVVTLLEEGIYFDWVGGISAGSSHAANYLSRDVQRTKNSFTEFALDPHFGNWRTFMRGQGLFNAQYIYEQSGMPGEALPFDWDTFVRNPARICVGGFEAVSGEGVYWRRDELAEFADLMIKVRASSTMPIVMPPVRVRDRVYVDGALGPSGGIPLDAAKEDGFARFLVVLTRDREYVKPPQSMERLYRRRFRALPALADALHDRPARYNATRSEIFELESAGQAYVFAPDRMSIGNGERDIRKLRQAYADGYAQAQRELPAIKDFLGI